jgi:hypothetical protein
MRRLILAPLAALLLVPALAAAATPDKATVSSASPKVTWSGTLEHPYLLHMAYNYEGTAGGAGSLPCEAPQCDTFTLDVAEAAPLTVVLASEQTPDISARVQAPDGTWTYYDGWSDGAKPTTIKFKKADKGTYVFNVVARIFGTGNPTAVDDTADYTGTATLAVAAPPAVAPVTVAPAPAPAAAPAPASKPAAKKKSCRAKAKKIKNAKKRKAALRRCAKKKRR